jgi:plasmid stability protein
MPNLSIKNVPEQVVSSLRERAAANHRSLQGELLALVSQAATVDAEATRPQPARNGYKSIEQIAAEHRSRVKRPITKGPRAVDLIRADRDAR